MKKIYNCNKSSDYNEYLDILNAKYQNENLKSLKESIFICESTTEKTKRKSSTNGLSMIMAMYSIAFTLVMNPAVLLLFWNTQPGKDYTIASASAVCRSAFVIITAIFLFVVVNHGKSCFKLGSKLSMLKLEHLRLTELIDLKSKSSSKKVCKTTPRKVVSKHFETALLNKTIHIKK